MGRACSIHRVSTDTDVKLRTVAKIDLDGKATFLSTGHTKKQVNNLQTRRRA